MRESEIKETLRLHKLWLDGYIKGVRADLSGADLRRADLRGANLRDANLRYTNLSGADLRDADLSGADLRNADLGYADLRDADLRRANLSGVDLSGVDLSGVDLRGADLSVVDLSGVDLRYTNLRDANLGGIDLSGVDLRYTNLRDADLGGIEDDLLKVLKENPNEVLGLREALVNGGVDGSTYEGVCCCLVGTIAKVSGVDYDSLPTTKPNCCRLAERWFLGISRGDTPENNQISAITVEWIDGYLGGLGA